VSKFVIGADGLIKMGKAGLLGALVGSHEVLVPETVYEEAVVRGKRELYEDAFELERLLEDEGVPIVRSDPEPQADRLLEDATSLGAGERSALRLYFAVGSDAVLSDDRVFLNFLSRHSVPFVTPVSVVAGLAKSRRVSRKKGLEALEKLSGFVRADVYERAKAELEGLRKKGEGDNG
jgi:predicted nucleic acid-binding protein